MVRIINYHGRVSDDGKQFFVLEVHGGIEMVRSQQTGQFYATARKANVSSTFDELTCKALIGTEMPGKICKAECEPYEYTIRDTGEIITLSHRHIYLPEGEPEPVQKSATRVDDFMKGSLGSFSSNGFLQKQD